MIFLEEMAGILIMFSAGLGTNLKSLIKSGIKSTIIACCGVFVPLIMGTVMALCFWGFDGFGTQEFFCRCFVHLFSLACKEMVILPQRKAAFLPGTVIIRLTFPHITAADRAFPDHFSPCCSRKTAALLL